MKAMTAEQYESTRISLGMTQGELADMLKISERQIRRRENTESPVSFEATLAIKFLLQRRL